MRTEMLALAVCSLVLLSAGYADETNKGGKDGVVREIDLKGYSRDKTTGVASKPTKIANAEELAKAIPDKEWRDRIAKQVDFDKEELLFFSWTGSAGTDELSFKVEETKKGPVVVFSNKKGRGEDFPRPIFRLYALAKNWRVDSTKLQATGFWAEQRYDPSALNKK